MQSKLGLYMQYEFSMSRSSSSSRATLDYTDYTTIPRLCKSLSSVVSLGVHPRMVTHLLAREVHWVNWKAGCKSCCVQCAVG